jgi:peptidyl-prolyl cis-trans isomerase D
MLQILRKKAQSTFIQIIVVIIALVFIFWGVGTNLSGNRQAALSVNDVDITFQEYQQAYDQAYQRLSDQFGGNMPRDLADSLNLKQQVINQLVQTALLRQGAAAMGLTVSAEEIRQTIEGMVQFQENGRFDIDRYKEILALNRMAPTIFEESMRHDRLTEVTARAVSSFGAVATDFEIRDIYSRLNEKVAVSYVALPSEQFEADVTIDEAALSAWYATARENYRTEPEVQGKYLVFTYPEIGAKITIDDDKVADYYRSNQNAYEMREQRRARHIIFAAAADAAEEVHKKQAARAGEVLAQARAGADFAELAREHSEGPSRESGGDLGYFSQGDMVPPFDQAVFALQPGQISEVVKTDFGYHIILLEDIRPAGTRPLEEVRGEIIATLQNREAEALAFQLANDAYEGIIGAGSLGGYAQAQPESEIRSADFFNRSSAPPVLRNDPQFLEATLRLSRGELSSLIKGQSGYLIFFAEDIREPEVPDLEAVRQKAEADYRTFKATELAAAKAEELLTALREGKELANLARENGFTAKESGLLGRNQDTADSDFPPVLLEEAFQLSASSPLPEKPGKVGDSYYVYSFVDRESPGMPDDPAEEQRYRENLLQFKQQQILAAWLQHLESEAEITQHRSL